MRPPRRPSLRLFLDDLRRHDWAPGLALSATYHPRELGRRPESLPRFIDEQVMVRLEREDALALLPDQTTRTLVRILIETGLRAIDARTLPLDALSLDATGAPYLRYFNHKLARERYLPIKPAIAEAIRGQQSAVRQRFPQGEPCLLPRERQNPDGSRPYAYGTLITRLRAWVRALDLRDEHGRLVAVTPHRFRHTVGTRMINGGVPQTVGLVGAGLAVCEHGLRHVDHRQPTPAPETAPPSPDSSPWVELSYDARQRSRRSSGRT